MLIVMKRVLLLILGPVKSWDPHEKLPVVSVRDLFTRFLDITTPPTTILLQYLATTCENENQMKQLTMLATVSIFYLHVFFFVI